MASNPVIWFEIYVQDMDRARKFYESVFPFKLEKLKNTQFDMLGFPMAKGEMGATGALIKIEGVTSGAGGTMVYFSCDDCAVEAARAAENGGQIHRSKFSIGEYGFVAMVIDTEGNMIGLHSMK